MYYYSPFENVQADNQIYYADHVQEQDTQNSHHHILNAQTDHNQISQQHHKISDNFAIQHYLSDQYCVTHPHQYTYQDHNARSDELDLHLIKEEEQFIRYALRAHSDELHPQHTIPSDHFEYPLPKVHENDQVYHVIDQTTQHHLVLPHAQLEHTPAPYVIHEEQQQIYLPESHQNDIIFLPTPATYSDQPLYCLDNQIQQYQPTNPKVEAQVEQAMEFVKKGPRGEGLYKVKEGTVNYYVKRGLTPDAVYNYQLAYIIGVGPPVETIETDGLKMEEGVCLRQAVREKMIAVDEAFKQIQGLHKLLFDAGMAHCDVKFENCLYFPNYGKVLLIDNGDLSAYGNQRTIKTEGTNSTILISPYGHDSKNKVGPATDLQGFIHIMFNAVHGPLS